MAVAEKTYSDTEIIETLSNYHWMIKEIKQIDYLLDTTEQNMTAQYGIEATMPKAKGITHDAMLKEVARRDKKLSRKMKMLDKVEFIQQRMHLITDVREQVVLDCLLDGMSINAIANHMGLSRRHIHRLRDSIVSNMSHMSHN